MTTDSKSSVTRPDAPSSSGSALITFVLAFAVVGILLGLGRQLTYKFAVTRRLERTYQIEKMLATRDALAIANTAISSVNANSSRLVSYEYPLVNQSGGLGRLKVDLDYIKDRDSQEMGSLDTWRPFFSDVVPNLTITPEMAENEDVFSFKAPITNIAYKSAVVKRAEDCWQNCEFGYLYRLDLHEGKGIDTNNAPYNLGTMSLYLVGVSGTPWDPSRTSDNICRNYADYLAMLNGCNWFKMELVVGSRDELAGQACRNLQIQSVVNGRTMLLPDRKGFNDFLKPWRDKRNLLGNKDKESDAFDHPGGFLLSSTAFCGFGSNSEMGMLFSRRGDVAAILNAEDTETFMSSFKEGVIVIEHEFPTIEPPENMTEREVTVASFTMREPTTYSISVYNKKLVDEDFEGKIATWIFQTQMPSRGIEGHQCILDTFGREPTSFFRERRGEVPAQ